VALLDCPNEDLLQAYVSRELTGADLDEVEAHVADCSRCTAVIAHVFPPGEPEEEAVIVRGTTIDRYHVLDVAGQGAIGLVLAAYDPKLDRKVALKVLRRPGRDLEQRLLREARAMARLSHANVVAVHDVGTFAGGLYVSMAFVEGQTLREWLAAKKRPWREIVAAFVQAGEGLAAAHAAGIVHRDFKPDNVLVRADGTIAVTDFGLARARGGAGIEDAPSELPLDLTATGALLGTPAYMSPEQLAGRRVDARSDVFSFCVSLHAALHGEHPFPLTSPRALLDSVESGKVRPVTDSSIPRAIRDAVRRGLRARPEDRPQSMRELLDALTRRPRRAALLALGGAGLVAAIAAVGVLVPRAARVPVCRGAERKLAGVWDADRREAIRGGLARTGSPLAGETARGVERVLDRYAAAWVAAHVDACEDTRVRGEQSEALLDRRMVCLDERRQRWAALVRSLERVTAADVARALPAAYELPGLDACADPRRVDERGPPVAPTLAPLVTLARASLAQARAQAALGRFEEGVRVAQAALAVARATQDLRLEAEASLVLALAHLERDPKTGEDALFAAEVAAERAGALEVTAEAEVRRVKNLGWYQVRTAEALRLEKLARAHVERLRNPVLAAELLHATAMTYQQSADAIKSIELHRAALAAFEEALGPGDPRVANAANGLAIALAQAGKDDDALAAFGRALDIRARALGPDHPDTLRARMNVGSAELNVGDVAASLAVLHEALALMERVLPPDHLQIELTLSNLANGYIALERFRDAAPLARRSVAMAAARGDETPKVVIALGQLAEALAGSGEAAEADAVSRRALAIGEKLGDEHPLLRRAVLDRGSALVLSGRCAEAMPLLRRALALFAGAGEGDHPEAAYPLDRIGRCELSAGRRAGARAAYSRALELRRKNLRPGHYLIALSLVGHAEVALADRDLAAARGDAAGAVAILEPADHPIALARARAILARASR
jgi:tetratricopeptide (TPR) repeat protein